MSNKRNRAVSFAARRAAEVATRLRRRRGIVGRVARALDDELGLEYLAQRSAHEGALIDRYVGDDPVPSDLKVSIVIPTYGVALGYVKELLASIRAQTYKNWEVCICDDHDPNKNVAKYLARLAERLPDRYRLVRHEANQGIAAATRTALTLVTGDVVAFVDEDDLLHARALEAVMSRFAAHDDVDLVYTDHDSATDLGFRRNPVRKPGWSPELLQSVNYINHLCVVRKSCLDQVPDAFGEGTSGSQDWDLCFKLIAKARRVAHVPLVLYHWRGRQESVAGNPYAKPWAHESGLKTRLRHLKVLDARLGMVPEDSQYRYHYEPSLEPDADVPPLTVVMLGRGLANGQHGAVTYQGWQRPVFVNTDGVPTNRDALARLANLANQLDDGLVLFVHEHRPMPTGQFASMAAFAIQPSVGAVWPFRNGEVGLCFTRHSHGDRLTQVPRPTNPFSRFSGNVSTGPLHCMLTRAENLRLGLDGLANLGDVAFDFLDRPHDIDAVGASLGLSLLIQRKRNVACRGMTCDIGLADVFPPRSMVPQRNPYV